jgi:hypothetical protein
MWHFFPRPITAIALSTTQGNPLDGTFDGGIPQDSNPIYARDVYLTVGGRPDGSFPGFPAGASVQLWYYRVDADYPASSFEYEGDAGSNTIKQTPVVIDLSSGSWSWDSTLSSWKMGPVMTMEGASDTETVSVDSVPPTYEYFYVDANGNYWDYFSSPTPEEDPSYWTLTEVMIDPGQSGINYTRIKYPSTISIGPFLNDLSQASPAALAMVNSWENNWIFFPTGIGVQRGAQLGSWFGQTSALHKARDLGLFSDFESSGSWYKTSEVTVTTDSSYGIGPVNPLMIPDGYTLTEQTATSRTWRKTASESFTITLTDLFFFEDWRDQQYALADQPVEGGYSAPNDLWDTFYDGGDFILHRYQSPEMWFDHGGDPYWLQIFDVDTYNISYEKLSISSVGKVILSVSPGFSFLNQTPPKFPYFDAFPEDIGSISFLGWSNSGGVETRTVTFQKSSIDEYPIKNYPWAEYRAYFWESESFGEDFFPLAVVGVSGNLASGVFEGDAFAPVFRFQGNQVGWPRIPAPGA